MLRINFLKDRQWTLQTAELKPQFETIDKNRKNTMKKKTLKKKANKTLEMKNF